MDLRKVITRFHPPTWASAALAFSLSMLFSFLVYPSIEQRYHAQQDVDRYGEIAKNLYNGDGFRFTDGDMPTVSRGPLYPLVIDAVSWLAGGYAVWPVQVLHALLLAGMCILIFYVGRQVFSADVGRWGAFAASFYPVFIWYSARIWTETFLLVLVALLAYRLARFHMTPTFGRGVMLGIVAAALTLVKAMFLLFVPFLLLYYIATRNGTAVRHGLLALLCVVVIVLPWTVRNYHVSGKIIPVQTTAMSNFLIGNVLAADFFEHPLSLSAPMQKGTEQIATLMDEAGLAPIDAEESEGEDVLRVKAVESMAGNPLLLVRKVGVQALTFWYLGETPVKSILLLLFQLPVVVLAVLGIRKARRNGAAVAPLLLIIVYVWGVAAFFISHARISVPVMPILILLAVYSRYRR